MRRVLLQSAPGDGMPCPHAFVRETSDLAVLGIAGIPIVVNSRNLSDISRMNMIHEAVLQTAQVRTVDAKISRVQHKFKAAAYSGYVPTLSTKLQPPRICPFPVKHHAIRRYHGISPGFPVHYQDLEY